MAVMVGIGRGARSGILVKDATALELLAKVDTLLIDKTGTLTEGKPELREIIWDSSANDTALRRLILSSVHGAENESIHPLAGAIASGIRKQDIEPARPESYEYIPGFGIKCRSNGMNMEKIGRAHV